MNQMAETKRDRVRRLLIKPLLDAGMKKQTRMPAGDYLEFQVRLADKLSYLPDIHLRGLVVQVMRMAKGPERNQWPDEVSITNWAHDLQVPPPRKHPFAISVLRSRAGKRARDLGYHAELLIALRKSGPPFSKYDLRRMPEEARENREELDRVARLVQGGSAPIERRQWRDWYLRHQQEAIAIMDADEAEFEVSV